MKNLHIEHNILILSVEEKERINIYTFVNLDTKETETMIGIKKEVSLHKPFIADISIKINKEVLKLEDGTKKYLNTATFFIVELDEV